MKRKLFLLVIAAVTVIIMAGCRTVENNYLKPEDFAKCLERNGLPVESVRKLPPAPFRASDACAIKLKGVVAEVSVYKYDQAVPVQQKRLKRIAEEKCTYVIGVKFPVFVHGSFMIFGLDKNPKKRAILKALKSFR